MSKIAVHFGAGALGRGLVIPKLREENYEIVIVDVDSELVKELNQTKSYHLILTDENNKPKEIFIKEALSVSKDSSKLAEYLNKAEVISTSVKRENLAKVSSLILKLLEVPKDRLILLGENVENVSDSMYSELNNHIENEAQQKIVDQFIIPNTMVDRICSSKWPDSLDILTEKYTNFSVEKVVNNTFDLKSLNSVKEIEAEFVKKRLLVNTFADMSAFYAQSEQINFLYESIVDDTIQEQITPYIEMCQNLLIKKYNLILSEVEDYTLQSKQRLSNSGIKREINTVARNLWDKLTLEERFAWPIIEAMKCNIEVSNAVKILIIMIQRATGYSSEELDSRLKKIWDSNDNGINLYEIAKAHIN